jgi:acetylornithine deacetylase
MNVESASLLSDLIGFPTVSRDSNLDLIEFVRAFLTARGFEVTLVPSRGEAKANLFATTGPVCSGGIVLSGHTDVVPADGQTWTADPFRLVERTGRYYGRGTADMKGFIACALRAADVASRRKLRRPLQLALSYDEEVGCVGVRGLLDELAKRSERPALCIVGEPTAMHVAVGHKGKLAGRATCCGTEAHSAYAPNALNAIHLAVDFVNSVRTLQAELQNKGRHDPLFEIPFTTLHVGKIAGGHALNIVPRECSVDFEIRNIPADDAVTIFEQLRKKAQDLTLPFRKRFDMADIRLAVSNEYPGLDSSGDRDALGLAAGFARLESHVKVPFGTEGGLFKSRLGMPTVVCGPGSMDQGHKPDEYVSIDQLRLCDRMMDAVVDFLAAA